MSRSCIDVGEIGHRRLPNVCGGALTFAVRVRDARADHAGRRRVPGVVSCEPVTGMDEYDVLTRTHSSEGQPGLPAARFPRLNRSDRDRQHHTAVPLAVHHITLID